MMKVLPQPVRFDGGKMSMIPDGEKFGLIDSIAAFPQDTHRSATDRRFQVEYSRFLFQFFHGISQSSHDSAACRINDGFGSIQLSRSFGNRQTIDHGECKCLPCGRIRS